MKLPKHAKAEIPLDDVKAIGRVQKLKPTMEEMASNMGTKVRYRTLPDGKREPYIRFKPNDGAGHHSKQGEAVMEAMRPFWRADQERFAALQSARPLAKLRDESGSVQYVEPEKADETAKRNRWRHHWRPRGRTVMRTFGGKLYRQVRGQWVLA